MLLRRRTPRRPARKAAVTGLIGLGLASLAGGPAEAQPAPAPVTDKPAADRPASRGAIVVLAGAPSDDVAQACRDIAREVYKRAPLRPAIDEAGVRVMCGSAPPSDASSEVRSLGELRESLSSELENAGNKALLGALAKGARANVVVVVDKAPAANGGDGVVIRTRWMKNESASDSLTLDPASFAITLPTQSSAESPWKEIGAALEGLLIPRAPATEPSATATHPVPGLGPRKSHLSGPQPKDGPPDAPTTSFFESPWFWVAAGGVAAIGVTILVVSQATDVGQGTVHVSGKVEP